MIDVPTLASSVAIHCHFVGEWEVKAEQRILLSMDILVGVAVEAVPGTRHSVNLGEVVDVATRRREVYCYCSSAAEEDPVAQEVAEAVAVAGWEKISRSHSCVHSFARTKGSRFLRHRTSPWHYLPTCAR